MSKYTTQLRFPIEQKLADLHLENLEENWPRAYDMLGLADYPIFDEAYRSTLNDKIIRRYYFREIGFETMGHFRMMLRRTMHEIMPYYNQMYESQSLVTDPMKSVHEGYTESWNRDNVVDTVNDSTHSSNSQTDSNGTNSNRNVYQDTPMSLLESDSIESLKYATNVTYDNGTDTNHATGSSSSTGHNTTNRGENDEGWRVHETDGFRESQSDLLMKYRKTFLNIDLEIVDRLDDLFMGLW
jgi:hypothetical protein